LRWRNESLGESVPEPSPPDVRDRAFPQGIASGDPSDRGVLLWARVEPPEPYDVIVVRWAIARDEEFAEVVTGGELTGATRCWGSSITTAAGRTRPHRQRKGDAQHATRGRPLGLRAFSANLGS